MLFLPKVQGTSPQGTRGFSPRSKDTSPGGPRAFLPKVQGGCAPRSTGVSPQGTRGLRPKPSPLGLVQVAFFAMPRTPTRGRVQQRGGSQAGQHPGERQCIEACCQAGGK